LKIFRTTRRKYWKWWARPGVIIINCNPKRHLLLGLYCYSFRNI